MKLNDTHLILLTTASQRENGSLIPLPESLGEAAHRVQKAIAALLHNGLVEEGDVTDPASAWRQDGSKHIGVRITDAGREAIGVETHAIAPGAGGNVVEQPEPAARPTKAHQVLTLLRRQEGATLDELTTATGWLPHTTRAALTGLRKKGHAIEKGKRGDATCWLVKAA